MQPSGKVGMLQKPRTTETTVQLRYASARRICICLYLRADVVSISFERPAVLLKVTMMRGEDPATRRSEIPLTPPLPTMDL